MGSKVFRIAFIALNFFTFFAFASDKDSTKNRVSLVVETECNYFLTLNNTFKFGPFEKTKFSQLHIKPGVVELSSKGKNSYTFETYGPVKEKFIIGLNYEGKFKSSENEEIADIYTLDIVRLDATKSFEKKIKTVGDISTEVKIYVFNNGTIQTLYKDETTGEMIRKDSWINDPVTNKLIPGNSTYFTVRMKYKAKIGIFDQRDVLLMVNLRLVSEADNNQFELLDTNPPATTKIKL